jgi:hypothetical protein
MRFASPAATAPPDAAFDFNPLGKWDFQIQDETGTRMTIEFMPNGSFQMSQQVGMMQVPINGMWSFNPLLQNLVLQGTINAFQPFILNVTLTGKRGNVFTAISENGVAYVLTRA